MLRRRRLPWRIVSGIGQTALTKPEVVDRIKQDLLAGRFRFDEPLARLIGWRDDGGTYYLSEGHHRMAAAIELFRETGEDRFVAELLANGTWVPGRPPRRRRLPTRGFWFRLLARFGL